MTSWSGNCFPLQAKDSSLLEGYEHDQSAAEFGFQRLKAVLMFKSIAATSPVDREAPIQVPGNPSPVRSRWHKC